MIAFLRQSIRIMAMRVAGGWKACVRLAAAPGGAWLLGAFLAANAAVVAVASRTRGVDSTVGSVLTAPFRGYEETGCWFPGDGNSMVASRTPDGGWLIQPPSIVPRSVMWADTTATIVIGNTSVDAEGIWSPWLETECGRRIRLLHPGNTSPRDLPHIHQAVIDAWPALSKYPNAVYARVPLEADEIDAIRADSLAFRHSVHWPWLANDLLVLSAAMLLFASHPARVARWRASRSRREIVNCPSCRYALAGLPTNAAGERTCPECGLACGRYL